jgi:Protein of unknown function (DUF3300)
MNSIRAAALLALLTMMPVAGFPQEPPGTIDQAPAPVASPPPQADAPAAAEPAQASVQPTAPMPTTATYGKAQLDQMLAPIALYPDTLLADVLMASTFPVQIVEAERWLSVPANAALKNDQLVAALDPMPWDPSVKSLVPFPDVIKQMSDKLDWTEALGTAFADQQADVMGEVQVLRAKAESCGTLTSTPQQRVVHEASAVVIQPTNPAVVYVPVYNPAVVYGVWAYPAFPPFFFVPDPVFFVGPVGIGIGFSIGFGVVAPFWGWGHPVWGEGDIFIDGGRWSRISYQHAAFAGSTFRHAGAIGRANAGAGRFAGGRFGVGRNSVARSSAAGSIGRASAGRGIGRHAAAAHSATHAGSHGGRSTGHTGGGRSGMFHRASSHAGGGVHNAAHAGRSGAIHGGNQHRH